ncbi:extracellular solute-binding protein [Pseudohalocynthiibacter aestuariivivens]|uniref:Polyamine ABC transporter substrate-binding protein n=1 Tax=Roseovarius pelagicus TaxID=2980108 RepID=A0ABY6DFX2_9RHOB|nr:MULTISPECIES: ABC transporter substrate-binding protein [Rhodobacterales]QIE46719.1 extracellular solute-binding protein [Pseudohalocynthiibacter aestuariivivens]UXX84744.1 polyamine ABC transporter substrate-binding protein [Roseovarius pelagicus]
MRNNRIAITAIAAAAVLSAPMAMAQDTLTVASWGGAYQEAQRKAWFDVVEKELNIKIIEDTTSGAADVRVQVASGSPTWDLTQQGNYSCAILEREGNVEMLDPEILAVKGIPDNMKGKGWISNLVYGAVLARNDEKFPDKKPETWMDFWDTEAFPGPRSLRRNPVYSLEAALIADGVPMDELYPLDTERAFKKLGELKDEIAVWWSSGAQSAQILQDGEVDMALVWNGRAQSIADQGAPVSITFNEQILLTDCWIIPKGAKNKELAMKAIEIMSRPEVQARIALFINYGPANADAFDTGVIPEDVAKGLPSHPSNASKGFVLDANYWAENLDTLTQEFDFFIQE